MARVVVEQGSLWVQGPPPKLLVPGIYDVPDDSPIIAEVLACEMPTIYVTDVMVPAQEAPVVPTAPTITVVAPVEPVDGRGAMTTADLAATKDGAVKTVGCPLCPERKDFANRGALSSHVRARHPELDPATLRAREPDSPSPADPDPVDSVVPPAAPAPEVLVAPAQPTAPEVTGPPVGPPLPPATET